MTCVVSEPDNEHLVPKPRWTFGGLDKKVKKQLDTRFRYFVSRRPFSRVLHSVIVMMVACIEWGQVVCAAGAVGAGA